MSKEPTYKQACIILPPCKRYVSLFESRDNDNDDDDDDDVDGRYEGDVDGVVDDDDSDNSSDDSNTTYGDDRNNNNDDMKVIIIIIVVVVVVVVVRRIIIIVIAVVVLIHNSVKLTVREFLQSPLRQEPCPARSLKWSGHDRVQITCNT